MHRPLHTRNHSLRHTVIHLRRAGGPFQFRVPVGLAAMRLPPLFDPPLHRGVLAGEAEFGHQPLVYPTRGMPLLARHPQSEAGHSSATLAYSPVIKDRVAARPPVDDGE